MRPVKKFLVVAVLLMLYLMATSVLLRSYYVYQTAYQSLSRLISHPSIEVRQERDGWREE